jgi:outer membrane protein OmpA-like peptidoglycan-associated protein
VKSNNKKDFFWVSYADLMTALFFIMLVLYVLTFVKLRYEQQVYKAKAEELDKIKEIEESINNIDSSYFKYDTNHKKHILNINVKFKSGSADMYDISDITRRKVVNAGKSVKGLVDNLTIGANIKYLVIIEGQASKYGDEDFNYDLSYRRALSLMKFWKAKGVDFDKLKNCELIIAGSGEKGVPRDTQNEKNNQRFLIHIIPKTGKIGE